MRAADGEPRPTVARVPVDLVGLIGLGTGGVGGAVRCPADLRGLAELVRAERRVLDAEAEFDAVLRAGGPMLMLKACDRELALASAARDARLTAAAGERGPKSGTCGLVT